MHRNYASVLLSLLLCFVISVSAIKVKISEQCLQCICEATSGCATSLRCFQVTNRTYCGPYQISYDFWVDAGRPGLSFETCATSKSCSEIAIRSYVNHYASDCNNDGVIDCLDFAIIHKVGPKCANNEWLLVTDYWNAFTETVCYSHKYELYAKFNSKYLSTFVNRTNVVDNECMRCLCEASSFCNSKPVCTKDGHCGPYLISKNYWIDAGKVGKDFVRCATNKTCAEHIVQNYMRKYYKDCNNDGIVDCDDFAAIHKLGPNCVTSSMYSTNYWKHFEYCSTMGTSARREVEPISYFIQIRGPTVTNQVAAAATTKPVIKKFNFPKFSVKKANLRKKLSNHLIDVSEGCLECICEGSSACTLNETKCVGEGPCGMFQIDKQYWTSAGRVGYRGAANDFERCVRDKHCASNVVRSYMNKYAYDCNNDGLIDCFDFALIHRKGAKHCKEAYVYTTDYWTRFETCHGFSR